MKISPRVEEPERDREREQDDEVEVAHAERSAQVAEPEQEDDAEGEPDADGVDLLAAECAAVAAGHLPRDLRPGPRLGDDAGAVVDAAGRDLACGAPPDADLPVAPLRVEGRFGHAVFVRVAIEPGGDLLVAEEDARRAPLRQLRPRGGGGERSLDEPALRVVDRPGRGRRRLGRGREHDRGEQGEGDPPHLSPSAAPERPELVAHEVDRRHEHDGDRL